MLNSVAATCMVPKTHQQRRLEQITKEVLQSFGGSHEMQLLKSKSKLQLEVEKAKKEAREQTPSQVEGPHSQVEIGSFDVLMSQTKKHIPRVV